MFFNVMMESAVKSAMGEKKNILEHPGYNCRQADTLAGKDLD